MEELGIGRPSTYASILQVLQDRGYVRIDKKRLIPEDKGRVVVAFLESFFTRYVEYDFTADLEEKLDRSPTARSTGSAVLADFWDRLHRRGQRHQGTAHPRRARRAQRSARAAHLPGAQPTAAPRAMPAMRHRAAVAEDRTLRRLHRLLELSGMQLHPADDARALTARSAAPRCSARTRKPASRSRCAAAVSAPICSSASRSSRRSRRRARRNRKSRSPSAPACRKASSPDDVDLEKALALLALPREVGMPSGRRRADPRRHRPLRALRQARQDLRQSRSRRRRARPSASTARSRLIAEKKANPGKGPPLRRRSGQVARRASRPRRPGRGQERPLRALCQPQRHQRHHHRRQDAGHDHA